VFEAKLSVILPGLDRRRPLTQQWIAGLFSFALRADRRQRTPQKILPFTCYSQDQAASLIARQAYLKASNTEAYDEFGAGIAVSGDTVAVAAFSESSKATGVTSGEINMKRWQRFLFC
jgi:hypothetical protein